MRKLSRFRPSPAMVVALIALFVAIGGVSWAAATIGTNDIQNGAVTAKKLHKKSVTRKKIKKNAVNGKKVKDDSLTGNDIDESTLYTVPSADHATSSDTATNADHATSTDTATNADNLDGQDSTAFLSSSSRGVAVAAARVTNTGSVLGYFNRSGGAPTVTHTTGSGSYTISFPGNSINVNIQIIQATVLGTAGEIAVDSVSGNVIVDTYNSAGAAADRQFTVVVFPASLSG